MSESSLNDLVENQLSKKSKDCIKWSAQILLEYAVSQKRNLTLVEQINTTELDLFLSKFTPKYELKTANFIQKMEC
jgi:hypothetical protein